MANPLTGDFDAVLQVSGGTVNRLLASMHQNGGTKPHLPSFPHRSIIRLGDDELIDGVKGTLAAQVDVPFIEFADRADDRFKLSVTFRARYTPDPGSEPLADWIAGRVSAEYLLTDINASCFGWLGHTSDHLWFKVVEDSLDFYGTIEDEFNPLILVEPLDEAATKAKVLRQMRYLMTTTFSPTPQKVSKRFRRGSMMSLNRGGSDIAVAIPLAPSGPPVASINQVFLQGTDFGVALGTNGILGRVQQVLDQLRQSFLEHITFHSETSIDLGPFGEPTVLTIDIHYTVTLTSATADWVGGSILGVSGGVVNVRISGQAVTQKSEYNLSFDVTAPVVVTYNAAAEGLNLAAATPTVAVHYSGPYSGDVINTATPAIQQQVAAQVQNVLGQVAGTFDLSAGKATLIDQLRTIDDNADAHFERAEFSNDGVVLLGRIVLSPRRPPLVTYKRTPDGNAYTAFDTWVPGGVLTSFDWSWRWAAGSSLPQGSWGEEQKYRLTRPWESGGPGAPLHATPIPGLDGAGKVCLYITGVQVDPVTGAPIGTDAGSNCQIYKWAAHIPHADTLVVRDPPSGPPHIEHPDWGVLGIGGGGVERPGYNTLVVHAGHQWSADTGATLREGLAASRRRDAGLLVIVLFDDGHLDTARRDMADELSALSADLESPLIVNEDVNGGWAAALGVTERREQPAWRLISPTGGVTWMSDDAMTAETFATALDDHLFPSRPATTTVDRGLDMRVVTSPIWWPTFGPDCPPAPFAGRAAGRRSVVFAMAGSAPSETRVAQLAGQRRADTEDAVVAIVRGATTREEAEAFAARVGEGVFGIPDPDGKLSAQAGVSYWPTSVTIDELGLVTGVDVGLDDSAYRGRERSS
jgi:hypothetical protein